MPSRAGGARITERNPWQAASHGSAPTPASIWRSVFPFSCVHHTHLGLGLFKGLGPRA